VPLKTGERLGPYEVLAPIGAGGMGEVYRAHDRRLERTVAVKVLPGAVAGDPDALARFEREAKAVAALSHPNILAIHDFGRHEGIAYAVMELLEGETLRERLVAGPLPVRKTVDYGTQIAHGLAAAHEKGIVHRDLKPENVFVTKEGRVKILDFGLARTTAPGAEMGPDATQSPTVGRGTEPGTAMGTVGYMSPEQVRGATADHRSDIFSFGCVLFEMLTGRRAFQGETAAETLTAILREDPPELSSTAAPVPPGLERIARHCLEKSPPERFQSASDIAFGLQSLTGMSSEAVAAAPARRVWRASLPLAAGAVLLMLAAGYFLGSRPRPGAAPTFQPLTFRRGVVTTARFTPDGHTVVYGASWEGQPIQAFSVRIGSPESTPLSIPAGDVLSVSPSGELAVSLGRHYQVFFMTSGRLARVSLSGGAPRELLDGIGEACWTPDGRLLVARPVGGKWRLELPSGTTVYQSDGWISHVRVSPSGDSVAFLEHTFPGADNGKVCVLSLSGKRPKKELTGDFASIQGLAWHPSGKEIWFTGAETGWISKLFAVTPSGRQRLVLRAPSRLLLHDIDAQGRVLISSETVRVGTIVGTLGGTDQKELSWLESSFGFSLSGDGKFVLLNEQGEGSGKRYGIYLRAVDGSPAVRLGDGFLGALSADGRWVVTSSQEDPQTLTILPTGAGEPRPLPAGLGYRSLGWFPDDKRVVLGAVDKTGNARLYTQDVAGGGPKPISGPGMGGTLATLPVSPDSRWVAVQGPEEKIFLCPTAGGTPVLQPEFEPGDRPLEFSADGRILYAARSAMQDASVLTLDLSSRKLSVTGGLHPADPAGILFIWPTDVTPDGRRYVYTYNRILSDLVLAEGLK
jgi:eukaryotic-like serine/threonine-protein kinase